jgi:hypothetical protein
MADKGIVAQVQKLVRDRSHLRTVISSMLTINRDMPSSVQIKPAIVAELEKALKYTDD